jgi:hypothetical protein
MQDAQTSTASAPRSGMGFASPKARDPTPALSEAASDTNSVATSNGGPPGAVAEVNVFVGELPFPLSAYTFANTTLVPVASTSTHPFTFQNFPPQILEESWSRSKRADDPEAYEPFDSEAGYHATPEEIELAAIRKAEKEERLQAKLNPWKGKAKEPLIPMGRAASKSRAMEKAGSADSATSNAPRRGRPPKSTLQQQVRAPSPPVRPSVLEPVRAPPQAAPQARPPPTQAPARQFTFTTRFDEPELVGGSSFSPSSFFFSALELTWMRSFLRNFQPSSPTTLKPLPLSISNLIPPSLTSMRSLPITSPTTNPSNLLSPNPARSPIRPHLASPLPLAPRPAPLKLPHQLSPSLPPPANLDLPPHQFPLEPRRHRRRPFKLPWRRRRLPRRCRLTVRRKRAKRSTRTTSR